MKPFDIEECRAFIEASSPETSIYIGSDSERKKIHGVWHFDVTVAVVVHVDTKHGCRVFGELTTYQDYDHRKDRPSMRLMQEVIAATDMYLDLAEAIGDRPVEVHLDINTDEMHGSSCVLAQAIGYVRGMTGIVPKVKPESFSASHTADRLCSILENK
ncbi:MAG: ribonuclease H-like YkuK family protein [Methylocystis sp.]